MIENITQSLPLGSAIAIYCKFEYIGLHYRIYIGLHSFNACIGFCQLSLLYIVGLHF